METQYPLAGLPIKQVLGAIVAPFRGAQKSERSSFIISQSRDDIWIGGGSRPPHLIHDYPEYETPSKPYEKGPITHFSGTITLAHPDEPHIYEKIWEILQKFRFHLIEHESKMRLLKTHSHTSERLGYEARKKAKKTLKEPAFQGRTLTQLSCTVVPYPLWVFGVSSFSFFVS